METFSDTTLIDQMIEVEKMACRIIEDAKEKGNIILNQARDEARRIVESTEADIYKEFRISKERLEKDL
ncbi:hypothetical protein JXL19_02620 [bacterium]|nr:hypothetical protein [bacterium]